MCLQVLEALPCSLAPQCFRKRIPQEFFAHLHVLYVVAVWVVMRTCGHH